MTKLDIILYAYLYLMEQKAQVAADYAAFCDQLPVDRDPETETLYRLALEEICADFGQLTRLQLHPEDLQNLPDGWQEEKAP